MNCDWKEARAAADVAVLPDVAGFLLMILLGVYCCF